MMKIPTPIFFLLLGLLACDTEVENPTSSNDDATATSRVAIEATFGGNIDLDNLPDYANQSVPDYITKDNTGGNVIENDMATLGRVFFYDKNLSKDNTVSCASCHQQKFAFGDPSATSTGVAGQTGRHSMRLINSKFSDEVRFFWDERANSLELQTTQPIQDHAEMGFSGTNGDESFDDLLTKLGGLDYYNELFMEIYGDEKITETRMQNCLAQFIRSIQSFDSKYDVGRVAVNNDQQNFTNFTTEENLGKSLFLNPPPMGGAGCAGCHRAPEFDIDPNSRNNGIVGRADGTIDPDLNNTRAPSLRDLFNTNGILNGSLMHDASLTTMEAVIEHYNLISITTENTNLDNRLRGGPAGMGQNLQLNQTEKGALVTFLKTLSGSAVYTDEKWSNPFE